MPTFSEYGALQNMEGGPSTGHNVSRWLAAKGDSISSKAHGVIDSLSAETASLEKQARLEKFRSELKRGEMGQANDYSIQKIGAEHWSASELAAQKHAHGKEASELSHGQNKELSAQESAQRLLEEKNKGRQARATIKTKGKQEVATHQATSEITMNNMQDLINQAGGIHNRSIKVAGVGDLGVPIKGIEPSKQFNEPSVDLNKYEK